MPIVCRLCDALLIIYVIFFFFPAEDGIRDGHVTGVQTCALPIYESTVGTTIGSVLVNGQLVNSVDAPAEVEIVLAATPFYAEAGGQLADQGTITAAGGATVRVDDVQSPVTGLTVHRGPLPEGTLTAGDEAVATIDIERRGAIARAHTATHMVHQSLREELGDSATQAGSENSPGRMRFDFRYGQGVPRSALDQIEGERKSVV